jgi:hypothetical protein
MVKRSPEIDVPPQAEPTITTPPWVRSRGSVLEWLCKVHGLRYGAEIGLGDGRTMAHVLAKVPSAKMVGVDSWATSEPTGEAGAETYAEWGQEDQKRVALDRLARFGGRARVLHMTSAAAAKALHAERFDFVFIDAAHTTRAVKADIKAWRPLLRERGFLVGHDANWPTVAEAIKGLDCEIGPDSTWIARP